MLEPESKDKPLSPGGFMGLVVGGIAVIVIVLMLIVSKTSSRSPFEVGIVPKAKLGAAMLHWGFIVTKYRYVVVVLVLALYGSLAGAGFPRIKMDQGSSEEWVPRGSRLQQRINDFNTLVDDSVSDRTYAYIMVKPKSGENMLDDPIRWLDAQLKVLKRAYAEAYTEATDTNGEALSLGWHVT